MSNGLDFQHGSGVLSARTIAYVLAKRSLFFTLLGINDPLYNDFRCGRHTKVYGLASHYFQRLASYTTDHLRLIHPLRHGSRSNQSRYRLGADGCGKLHGTALFGVILVLLVEVLDKTEIDP